MHVVDGSRETAHDVMGGFGARQGQLSLQSILGPIQAGMIPLAGCASELPGAHVGLSNDLTLLIRVHLFNF